MRTKYHYYVNKTEVVLRTLNHYDIKYKISSLPLTNTQMCSFDLYDDQSVYLKFKALRPFLKNCSIIKSIEYEEREIENSDWLFVRSKNKKVEWEYDESAFSLSCAYRLPLQHEKRYKHVEQTDLLTVKSPVNWGSCLYFSGPNSADDFLFCSAIAKQRLEGRWLGLDFLPVRRQKSGNHVANIYQLVFNDHIPFAAFRGGKISKCSSCGRQYIQLSDGVYQLEIQSKFLNDGNRVYQTGPILSDQAYGNPTYSVNIVPQSFYQYCKSNHMNNGMIYEPVNLF